MDLKWKIVYFFLTYIFTNVTPVIGRKCYYSYTYNDYYDCESDTSTIAGYVAGAIISIIVVAAIIFCICNHSNRGNTVTTIHSVQPTVANVQTAHQQQQPMMATHGHYPPGGSMYPPPGGSMYPPPQDMAYPPPPSYVESQMKY